MITSIKKIIVYFSHLSRRKTNYVVNLEYFQNEQYSDDLQCSVFLEYCLVYLKMLRLTEKNTCSWMSLKIRQSIAIMAPYDSSTSLATSFQSHAQNPHRI